MEKKLGEVGCYSANTWKYSSLIQDLESIRTESFACCHGHSGCAIRVGGECSDDRLSRLGLDNDGEIASHE